MEDRKGNQQLKDVGTILEEQIQMSLHEYNRSNVGLFFSSFAAGLEIGFSVLLMGTILMMFGTDVGGEMMHFYLSLCYPIGFIFVILGRSELYTEHTTLALLPVLNRSRKLKNLLVLWGLVYAGNILGGYLFSLLTIFIAPIIIGTELEVFTSIAEKLVSYDNLAVFLSAILAGWLMGLLGWLVTSSQDTISRILLIILITFLIGLFGLHHCVIGSIEVFLGMLSSEDISLMEYLNVQLWTTIGNTVGGSIFVALLKYGHVRAR